MLLTLDAGLFNSNTFEKTNNHSTWSRGNDAMFFFVCVWMFQDVTRSSNFWNLQRVSCIFHLTRCLDDSGMAEPPLHPVGAATAHLCSWKDLQFQTDLSFSWHHPHRSKMDAHMHIGKICHFCRDLWKKKKKNNEKNLATSPEGQNKSFYSVGKISLSWI